MVNYECIDCCFYTTLKNNYTRHMTTKKHFLISGSEPTEADLIDRQKIAKRNKQDYVKFRTPEHIDKHNKNNRDRYKNDELYRLRTKILNDTYRCNNKEKVADRQKKYAQKNRDKINKYHKKYIKKEWWRPKIQSSKSEDKKYNRYDPIDYIDKDFIFEQRDKQNNKCDYCRCDMTTHRKGEKSCLTVERIDNDLGHNKSNCVLACFECNVKRRAIYSYYDFHMKIIEATHRKIMYL